MSNSSSNEKPRVCCDFVIEKNGKVLMGKRGNVFGKGTWALVGGHLELNEKTVDCVKRELMEEVGIIPKKMKLLGVVNDISKDKTRSDHYIQFVYYITDFSGKIQNKDPDKCEGWEWFERDTLPKPTFIGHVKVLKLFFSKQTFYE